ncbi:MAG: sodium/solute symporter [Planctomycetota bacterium]
MQGLTLLDWVVLAVYGAVVLAIGAWAKRRQRTTEDYFLGGRGMRWWAVGVSLIATSFSSVALIGATGFGFAHGMGWLQLQAGDLVGIGVALFLFLPFFSRLRLTTAYEYLERRFGVGARTLASALFIVQTLLRAGILVYGPALALSAILGMDLRWAIAASGLAAVVYSSAGGIQAVVWTDLIQLAVVLFGVVFCLELVASDVPGGLATVLDHARDAGRLQVADGTFDPRTPFNLPGALIAYGVLALSVAATNQQAVQRYMACKDLASARRAAFLGWGIGLVAVALTLFLGVALFVWSETTAAGVVLQGAGDQALPRFIATRLPAGVSGLLVAAIFAASMSSMDSAIHSMSTATIVDFVRRFRRKPLDGGSELRLARLLVVLFGLVATGVALFAPAKDRAMLETLITWLTYVAGPLLGLFALGVLSRRATEGGALIAVALTAVLTVVTLQAGLPARLGVHELWLGPAALLLTFGLGWAGSCLFRPPGKAQLAGLTWWTRHDPLASPPP